MSIDVSSRKGLTGSKEGTVAGPWSAASAPARTNAGDSQSGCTGRLTGLSWWVGKSSLAGRLVLRQERPEASQ